MLAGSSLLRLALSLGLFLGLLLRHATAAEKAAPAQPSVEECEKFGRWIVERFDEGKVEEIAAAFDAVAFMRIATAGLGVSEAEVSSAASGISRGFGEKLEAELGEFDSARFVRVQEKGNQRRVLIRFLSEEGALNYKAFICARGSDSQVKWIDSYNYSSGESFSASTRNVLLPLVAKESESRRAKLSPAEKVYFENLSRIQRILALTRGGKSTEALALLQELPDFLRKERFFLLLEMRIAQAVDEAAYLKALAAIDAAIPDDPTLDLLRSDGRLIRKDHAGALRLIDSFEKEIGRDAWLDYSRANVHNDAEDWPAAKKFANDALAVEPDLIHAHQILLSIGLTTKNYKEVAEALTRLAAAFPQLDLHEGIKDDDDYADFRKSPEYAAWAAEGSRKAPKPPPGAARK